MRGMEVEPVANASSHRRPVQVSGVTAQLAEARKSLREAAPPGRWDAVAAEVSRLQRELGLSPLAALQAVYDKLAAGWMPPAPR